MDNDFGWKRLSKSYMNENAVFMLLTAMARNIYLFIVQKRQCRNSASKPHQEAKDLYSGSSPFLPNGLSPQDATSSTYIQTAGTTAWSIETDKQIIFVEAQRHEP